MHPQLWVVVRPPRAIPLRLTLLSHLRHHPEAAPQTNERLRLLITTDQAREITRRMQHPPPTPPVLPTSLVETSKPPTSLVLLPHAGTQETVAQNKMDRVRGTSALPRDQGQGGTVKISQHPLRLSQTEPLILHSPLLRLPQTGILSRHILQWADGAHLSRRTLGPGR